MRADRPLWLIVAALGVAVLALAMRSEHQTFGGIGLGSIATLITGVVLIVMVFGALSALIYTRIGETLRLGIFWLCIIGAGVLIYSYRSPLQSAGDRVMAELSPATAYLLQFSGRTVEIARAREGDFNIKVEINGTPVAMLVDTGASSVVLTAEAAKKIGLPVELLKYDVPIETANGRSRAAPVVLERLAIGNIVERAIPALVSAPSDLKLSLLGMSFLKRMESIEMHGERMVMRGK